MANINNIRLGKDYLDSIRFPSYAAPLGNQFTYFGSIVAKDNTERNQAPEGEWEINDDCEIEIISPRRIAIKKFKIDTWIIRRKTGPDINNQTDEINLFGKSFKVKVTGLDYVHNNIICHTAGSNTPDGFTEGFIGTGGWNVGWYPGQYTEGQYAKGLLIQGCMNYAANANEMDRSLHMGRAPWDIGKYSFVTDGEVKTKAYWGIGCCAICIGLFGGVQNATSWGDNSNGAYRVYDISDTPIIIDLDVQDTINYPVDLSTKECWDAYVGDTKVYHKDKTIENCWKKYGLATNTYTDSGGNIKEYGYTKVTNVSGHSFEGGFVLPETVDWEDNIHDLSWNIKIANTEFWEKVRTWFETNYVKHNMIAKMPLFAYSNIGGKITLKFNEWHDEEQTIPNLFMWGQRIFQGSNIEHVHIISENGCSFSSGNGLFLGSGLNQITFESPKGWLIGATDVSGMLSQCAKLTSYPYNLINWAANRSNTKTYGIYCTLIGYCFEYTPFEEIPSYNQEDRFADNNTIIFTSFCDQVFNGCRYLTKIGPVLDLCIVVPGNGTKNTFNCPSLQDVRIKNLNHGNWSLDGVTRDEGYIGNLPLLNQESITYLFENLTDLTTHAADEHINNVSRSFATWGSAYWDTDSESETYIMFRYVNTKTRYAEGTDAAAVCYTNQTFEEMKIDVYGLQEGDRLEFGSGVISESENSITSDGVYTISKTGSTYKGFKLYSTNTTNKSTVSIVIVNGYDPKNPLVSNANLYCPADWEDKITDSMISSANTKGWNIYIGGVLVTI